MTSIRIIRAVALASIGVCLSLATASAQPASTPSPDAKGQQGPQGFRDRKSVV